MVKWFTRPAQTSQAIITQNRVSDATGKPGMVTVPNVATFNTRDGHLEGKDTLGNVIMVVPLAELSAAIIERK